MKRKSRTRLNICLKQEQSFSRAKLIKKLAEKVISQLLLLEAESDEPVKVMIDSPGGDVDAGYAIFDMIRFIKPEVYTIGMGLVASAGALILLAAPKDKRLALPNSHYLIHQPLSGIRGVATEIENSCQRKLKKQEIKSISLFQMKQEKV